MPEEADEVEGKYKIIIQKAKLGKPKKKVKEMIIDSEDEDFKEEIENWFGRGSFDFVKKKLEEQGYWGEAVGQGLAGYIRKIGKNKLKKEVI